MGELRRASEVRQAELVDAALHLVATKGIAALGTRTLAEQVGLTSGAIFRHFPSLDALLEAVVARVEAVLESTYPPPGLPPRARLARFIETRSAAVGQQLGILRLVLSEQFLLALPAGGSTRLSACVQKSRAFVTRALREGQQAGQFRADVSAETLAPIVMGTMQVLALSTASSKQRATEVSAVRGGLLKLLAPARPTRASRHTAGRRGRAR